MRCPECGQWNRSSVPTCIKCGSPLQEEERPQPSWRGQLKDGGAAKAYIRVDEDGEINTTPDARDTLADEMAELKKRKDDGMRQQRRLREESAARGAAPSTMTIRTHANVDTFWSQMETDEPDASQRQERKRTSGSRTQVIRGGRRQTAETGWVDPSTYDPLWTETAPHETIPLRPQSTYSGRLPTRRRAWRRILYTILAMMCGALLVAGGYLGWQWYQNRRTQILDLNRPLISSSIMNDLAAHTILIPGKPGETVYISELHTAYQVSEDGYATVEIEDHIWYDDIEDLQTDSIDVEITPYMKSAAGGTSRLDLIHYTVDIPESPITLDSPDSLRQEVVSALYSLRFTVRPGSTVYMNGKDISDTVDATNGDLTYNATVQPIGDNVFTLRVRSPYCRENAMTVTLYREPQEIPLDLAADTYTSTTLQTLQISCTTLPGATVDVLSDHTDLNITNLASTGEFSFYAVFNKIGNNTISITASYPGKKTSQVDYVIYYVPTQEKYTMKAWPLSTAQYAELVGNINYRAEHNQVYVVMAKLAYIVSDKPQMGVFYTSDDGKSQPVLVENFTKTTWKVGTYYRIYGDAYGTYDSMPWLCGRYTYLY